jgi:hypothetical protein
MLVARPSPALAFALAVAAAAFGCGTNKTAGTTGTTGTGGSNATSSGTATGGAAATTATGAGGNSTIACSACLGPACAKEQAACGTECLSIQACIDAVCQHLSAIASSQEGQCQVHCQSLHVTGKQAHLAFVDCAVTGAGCEPPCSAYDYDYKQCIAGVNTGSCKDAFAPCDTGNLANAGNDCVTYQTCLGTCSTLSACLHCASTPGGAAGEKLFEAYQLCIAESCFAEGWLPG